MPRVNHNCRFGVNHTVLSWAPNTTKSYLAGWNDFTSWRIEHRCPGLPAAPADLGRYLEDLMETQGKALITAHNRLAAHRRSPPLREVPQSGEGSLGQDHAQATGHGVRKPRKQARGLSKEALAAVKATARIQRLNKGKRRRKETESRAAMRAAVDLALLEVMRDGVLRGSEA